MLISHVDPLYVSPATYSILRHYIFELLLNIRGPGYSSLEYVNLISSSIIMYFKKFKSVIEKTFSD